MRGSGRFLGSVVVLAAMLASAPAQFTPGNIVVLRIGNGSTGLSSSSFQGTLIEIDAATGATTGVTVALPTEATANSGGITFSGSSTSATSAPYLHRSTDGAFLTTIGYDTPIGTATVNSTTSSAANRTIARIGPSGAVTTQQLTDSTFSGGRPQAVVSDGSQVWLSGSASSATNRGIRYVSGPSASTSTRLVDIDPRDINLFNGRLFYSTSEGVFALPQSPPPTSGTPNPVTVQSGLVDAHGFVLFDRSVTEGDPSLGGLDTLYIADGTNLRKLEFAGGTWNVQGSSDLSQLGTLFGLTGRLNGGSVELFATDSAVAGNLAKVVDNSAFGDAINLSNGWGSAYSPGANYTLRGVEFTPTPVPEPATVLGFAAAGLGLAGLGRRATRRSSG